MKRKLRIFSNIAIICLSVCMFAFGVYAASTVSVTTSGTVSFSATDVYANVTKTVSKELDDGTIEQISTTTELIDSSDQGNPALVAMGTNETLAFDGTYSYIHMTFTIENLATDRNIDFTVTSVEDADRNNIIQYYVVSANEYKTGTYNVNAKATGVDNTETITITFKLLDVNKSGNLDYNYTINMTCQDEVTTAIEESASLRRYGNTYVLDTTLESNKQLTKNTVTGTTSYCEYLPTISETTVSSVFHIYGTEGNAITGITSQVDTLDTTRLKFSTTTGVSTVSQVNSSTAFPADYHIPMAINNAGTMSLVSKIGSGGFAYNTNITSMVLPITILEIESGAFVYCGDDYNVSGTPATINLPKWITVIENSAFYAFYELKIIGDLPKMITSIESDVFNDNQVIQSISVPVGVRTIEEGGFECSNMTTISLPISIELIGLNALAVETINYAGTKEDWSAIVFSKEYSTGASVSIIKRNVTVICSDGTKITATIPSTY